MGTPCCMGLPFNPALYNCNSEYTLLYKDSGNKKNRCNALYKFNVIIF